MRHKTAIAFLATGIAGGATAVTDRDIDRLTTYAVVLGRAKGCDIDTSSVNKRLAVWLDKTFPPGSAAQKTYLPLFAEGVMMHMQQQREGKSPDSCTKMRQTFAQFPWP